MESQGFLQRIKRYATPHVLLAALGLAVLLGGAAVFAMLAYLPASTVEDRAAALTWIPGPTNTPAPTATLVPTSTPTPSFEPPASGQMGVGAFVQIIGTEGRGLNIRNAPGLATTIQFLAYDAEVFVVRDGPREVDGLIWWYIVTPVDAARAGWAAGTYLEVVVSD
ncbi:MAG TPA: hypothetical protein PLC52_04070 [Anaerolineales bacterium]|nr:hypothetical protein [Anaerolineales bacterium]HRQ92026.1 hypothetical protein [Anaerolineales bacterium]